MATADMEPVAESQGKTEQRNPYLTIAMAWAVPGAGHFLLGRRWRALIFLVLILFSAVVGLVLDGRLFVAVEDQPLSRLGTLASMAMGLLYFVLRFGVGYEGDLLSGSYEYGSAFLLTAGLMKLLVMLDAWDIATRRKE